MSLILLARAIHVVAGVIWAGAVFVLTAVVMPLAAKHGAEGAGRWLGMVARRAGMMSGISALLTVLSGIYLFATLHSGDRSTGGLILMSGAVSGLLAFALAFMVTRPAALQLTKLQETQVPGKESLPDVRQQMERLRVRSIVSSRATAVLLGLSVIAMGVFRYAAAVA